MILTPCHPKTQAPPELRIIGSRVPSSHVIHHRQRGDSSRQSLRMSRLRYALGSKCRQRHFHLVSISSLLKVDLLMENRTTSTTRRTAEMISRLSATSGTIPISPKT